MMVESANKNDYEKIVSIMQEGQDFHCSLRPDLYKIIGCSAYLKKRIFNKLVKQNMIWIARDKEIMGFVICRKKKSAKSLFMKSYKSLVIDFISVSEKYKQHGVATELINYVFERARKEKYEKVELQVCANNTAAINLYNKLRFSEKSINLEKCV